jgi:hypothetical protein
MARAYSIETVDIPVLDDKEKQMISAAIKVMAKPAWGRVVIYAEDGESVALGWSELQLIAKILEAAT